MDKTLSATLADFGFTEENVAALEAAERQHGMIQNWPGETFGEVLADDIRGRYAAMVVSREKSGAPTDDANQVARLPEKPPYLATDAKGVPKGYDPTDPSQYYTDDGTGEMWRWDGKRARSNEGKLNDDNKPIEPQRYPFGQPHRVISVPHQRVDGVAVPDPTETARANAAGYDWFHHGYGVWVGNGGKPYRDVSAEVRRRVRAAREQVFAGGNPAIVR
jgi:hypothetical protein